jgi:hypothetical protein
MAGLALAAQQVVVRSIMASADAPGTLAAFEAEYVLNTADEGDKLGK